MTEYRLYGDWGTSRLRLWRIEQGAVVDEREDIGIGLLDGSPPGALAAAIAPLLSAHAPTRLVLCGMAGARNGLQEAPYVECPAEASAWQEAATELSFQGTRLRIAAGVACRIAGRSDVMRGEETQLFGAIRQNPELAQGEHVVVLPGTHSKWVVIEGGRITAFRTFLTGEVYALLQNSSLLAIGNDACVGATDAAFSAGLDRAVDGCGVLGGLFEARAAQLRDERSTGWAAEFLSGLLLGSELAEMRCRISLPGRITLIGSPGLAHRYSRALEYFDIEAKLMNDRLCTLAGLGLADADN